MERKTKIIFKIMNLLEAKKIMGKNFIGPDELKKISSQLGIKDPFKFGRPVPKIPFSLNLLKKINKDYILILGMPQNKKDEKLTINKFRSMLGWNPAKSEPCMYNQDWYLNEKFANNKILSFKWYLIKKTVNKNSRGKRPDEILKLLRKQDNFPSAILTVYTFFVYYFYSGNKILWKHDFIWCSDKDKNGDIIYTGRYNDPKKINKNGFNVHRHLSIRSCYGLAQEIK